MSSFHKQSFLFGSVFIISVFVLAVILLTPSRSPAAPQITWTPSRVVETISPGESKAVSVTLTSSETVSNIAVRVVPELQPFVRVEPSYFAQLEKGQLINISVIFSAGQESLFASLDGTIQIESTRRNVRIFANPLPVKVTVLWPEFQSSNWAIQLQYPGNLTMTEHLPTENAQVISFVNNVTGEGFSIEILRSNPDNLDIVNWADQQEWPFPADWRNYFIRTWIAGLEALQDPLAGLVIFTKDRKVYFVTNGIGQDPILLSPNVFENILQSIQIFD